MSFSAGDDAPSPAEWAVMAISVALTLALFGYVAWHAATTPADGPPEASVAGTEPTEDGRLAITVEVANDGRTGLESVTVGVDCAVESITFQHVPADARRRGVVVCPPDSEAPSADVRSWIEA